MYNKADLHIHTKYSFDGLSEPRDVVLSAEAAGLSVIAITDHERLDGALEAEALARGRDLDVIVGEEIYTGEGEVIGLFLTEHIPPREGLLETIHEIHDQGGLVLVPHPFSWSTLKETITVRKMRAIYEHVDAIEIINPSFFGRRGRKKAPRLNRLYGLAEVGSSDAHHHKQIGHAYTIFEGAGAAGIRDAIEARETEAGIEEDMKHQLLWLVKENFKKLGVHGFKHAKKKISKYTF